MTQPVHSSHADAVKAKWFSRRHQTNDAHLAARAAYAAKQAAKKNRNQK